MRKIISLIALLLCLALTLSLTACGEDNGSDNGSDNQGGENHNGNDSNDGGNSEGNGGSNDDSNDGSNSEGNGGSNDDSNDGDVDTDHTHVGADPVQENEVAGTCQIPSSYDRVVYCVDCGEEIEREQVVGSTTDHEYVIGECMHCGAADPDFDEEGGFIGPWDPVVDGIDTPIIPIG